MTCYASIKKSFKRGLWQIKEPNHNIISLGHAHDMIEKCMFIENIDFSNRESVHKFIFSDTPLEDYTCQLKFENGYFKIIDNEFDGKAEFPDELFKLFESVPTDLYIKITTGNFSKGLNPVALFE